MKIRTKTMLIDARNISTSGKILKLDKKRICMLNDVHATALLDKAVDFFKIHPEGVFDMSQVECVTDRLFELQRLMRLSSDTNSIQTYEYEYSKVRQELAHEFSKL